MLKMLTGAMLIMNSTKPMPALLAMIMFGGSPTMVAAPPMLEAKTCESRNGTGLRLRVRHSERVIGTARTTTVTLSRKADATAVSNANRQRVQKPLPRTS